MLLQRGEVICEHKNYLDSAALHLGHSCVPMNRKVYKKALECKHSGLFHILFCSQITAYLLLNCGARRAALRPYFFLSFILGSRVR